VLWALGLATSYTAGGQIHILLAIGLVVLVIRLIQGRRIMGSQADQLTPSAGYPASDGQLVLGWLGE
jgi:hypothetical protein